MLDTAPSQPTAIARAPFGRTGHLSSRAIFGAAALSNVTQSEADRAIETALGFGVNHFDTAASYGDSETLLGPWLQHHRSQVFLATKTGQRERGAALDELQRSLERLRTDHVDLWQLHNLVDEHEWERALGPGGALEAAIEAREQGLVRFIGVTGHGVEVARRHLDSLRSFPFDSVLLPYSYVMMRNEAYARDFEALARECAARGVAVQTIKAITRRPWGERQPDRPTWYQPLEEPGALSLALHWVLGREEFFVNTAGDVGLLPAVLAAVSRYRGRPGDAELADLVGREVMEPLFV